MLNTIAAFVKKFDALLVTAFEAIEKKQQPKKILIVEPALQKSKWEIIHEKRLRKQQQKRMKTQHQYQKSCTIAKSESSAIDLNEEVKIEFNSQVKHALYIDKDLIRSLQSKEFGSIANKMSQNFSSFLLTEYVHFKDTVQLSQAMMKSIYNTLLEAQQKSKGQNTLATRQAKNQFPNQTRIIKGQIILLQRSLEDKVPFQQAKLIKNIEDQLCILTEQKPTDEKREQKVSQLILKKLRRAKIYRHSLTLEVQSLIGQYLLTESKSEQMCQYRPCDYEASDIGLFDCQISVDEQEARQILRYWQFKYSQLIQSKYSRFQQLISSVATLKFPPLQKQNIIQAYFSRITALQNYLIDNHQKKFNQQIDNAMKNFANQEQKFAQKQLNCKVKAAKEWNPKKPQLKVTTFCHSTCLRLFKKWRSFQIEDGLSASSFIMRLVNGQIKYEQVINMLLKDYDEQVIKPRNKYIDELVNATSKYSSLYEQLTYEEQCYERTCILSPINSEPNIEHQQQEEDMSIEQIDQQQFTSQQSSSSNASNDPQFSSQSISSELDVHPVLVDEDEDSLSCIEIIE